MGKQIKVGLDKIPAPVTKQFTQLVDIEGTKLFDAAGNPLVTEEEAASGAFTSAQNALSVHVNNGEFDGGYLKVQEQFPETSDVSSSLLGVPRAEEQLSLFADVATYGLDEEQWSTYAFSDNRNPYQWYQKMNPVYGRRSQPKFYEGSTEQALYLSQYPSQYSYPRGPIERREQTPTDQFREYMNFIALGKYFYNTFATIDLTFAEKFFISDDIAYIVDSDDNKLNITWDSSGGGAFVGSGSFHDVKYANEDEQLCYDQIESWTYFLDLIKDNLDTWPPLNTAITDYKQTGDYDILSNFAKTQCRPGGSPLGDRFAILESKRSFRYQPGRASGFTFGTRMKADPTSLASVLEWGCSNETDEYMFQLKGSQFNIIRRSTIRMPDDLLVRQGLRTTDQSTDVVYVKGVNNSQGLHETVIPRSRFNGDSLLGSGDSGYILSFEDVTMYKIEFSWYGAIGAKFYAYVPVGNGEARWVLLHTFVIENGLGKPVLNNPDFKFKYLTSCSNSSTLKAPQFVYKYGSSYYVDGGDEGTVRLATTTVDSKPFSTNTAILGILPKNDILNRDGVKIPNSKKCYPSTVSVSASEPCRIDIEEIKGSPDGIHFNFSPSIVSSGDHPDTRYLDFKFESPTTVSIASIANPELTGLTITAGSPNVDGDFTSYATSIYRGDTLVINGAEYLVASRSDSRIILQTNVIGISYVGNGTATVLKKLNAQDDKAKIIADGVYGAYVDYGSFADNRSSRILMVDRDAKYELTAQSISRGSKADGISYVDPKTKDSFSGKLSGFYTIVASKTPIYSNKFKIHWLNPISRDGTYSSRHFADFGITVTPYLPIEAGTNDGQEKVEFKTSSSPDTFKSFDIDEYPLLKFSHASAHYNAIKRATDLEWDSSYGYKFDTDPRLNEKPVTWQGYPNTANRSQAGRIQAVEGEVGVFDYQLADTNPVVLSDGSDTGYPAGQFYKVTFGNNVSGPDDSSVTLDDSAEIGADFVGTGKFFESKVFRPGTGNNYFYASLGNGSTEQNLIADLSTGTIQLKTLTLRDDWKLESRTESGVARFTDKKFAILKIVPFGAQPFYPVFALKNKAVINSIVIEEITADGVVKTHNPELITESSQSNPNISIENYGSLGNEDTPCAFNTVERLESCKYDTSTLQPLRPGTNISSFFVGADDPTEIPLDNIFETDRRGISRGLLNDKAIYFKATSLSNNSGVIQMTLTAKEQ